MQSNQKSLKNVYEERFLQSLLNIKQKIKIPLINNLYNGNNSISYIDPDLIPIIKIIFKMDNQTIRHLFNVSKLSISFWETIWFWKDILYKIAISSICHDIWKYKIMWILKGAKNRKLYKDEYEEVKKHTIYWYEICKSKWLKSYVCQTALFHHLSFNQSIGYPDEKLIKKHWLPKFYTTEENYKIWQVVSIIDHFESANDKSRASFKNISKEEIIDDIISEFKNFFDPKLKEPFLDWVEKVWYLIVD